MKVFRPQHLLTNIIIIDNLQTNQNFILQFNCSLQVDVSVGIKVPQQTQNSLSPYYKGPSSIQIRKLSKNLDQPSVTSPKVEEAGSSRPVQTVASIEHVVESTSSQQNTLNHETSANISVQMTKSLQILNEV
jgi:hypothetical protein